MKRFASFISWLFVPLFVPLYGLLLALYLPTPAISFNANESLFLLHPALKMLLIILFLFFIVLAPGISLLLMKRNKTISSLEINDRKERLTPIGLITFYYITLLIFLHLQKDGVFVPPIIKAMVFGGTVSGIATFIITRKMKISFHSLGMGSLFGFLYMFSIPLSQPPVLVIVLVILSGGIVMTSRLILNAHTLKEIGWGYALGVVSQIICIYLYLKFI